MTVDERLAMVAETFDALSVARGEERTALARRLVEEAEPLARVQVCEECGVEFTTLRRPAKTCSDACRTRKSRRLRGE